MVKTLQCEACEEPFEARSKAARFCKRPECVRQRARMRKRESLGIVVAPVTPLPVVAGQTSTVLGATMAALVAAGRESSPAGLNALAMASRLDVDASDTGSSLAAVSKQHLAALEVALKGAVKAEDKIDELRERRRRRFGA